MCDVMVALGDTTKSGRVIFGKNSDRPAGECQVLFRDRGGELPEDEVARCSYVTVPRGKHTVATMGLRPYWCWGYETGINEAGVVGGNAAIFTRNPTSKRDEQPGLTGMDLLRLGLERGRTAEECVGALCTLLEEYGQWGSAIQGRDHEEGSYDNSFLFADPREAWVVETSGRDWVAQRITSGVRTISNELTIRTDFERSSEGVRSASGGHDLDFARLYEDHEGYSRQVSHLRVRRTQTLLERERGRIDARAVMRVLRDHYEDSFIGEPSFDRFLPDFQTVCMHDSPAGFTWGDTASSLVVELGAGEPVWVSYLPPCCSVFVPVSFGSDLPEMLTRAGSHGLQVERPGEASADAFEASSLWWRLHRIIKVAAKEPGKRYPILRSAFDSVEAELAGSGDAAVGSGRLTSDGTEALQVAIEGLEKRWM